MNSIFLIPRTLEFIYESVRIRGLFTYLAVLGFIRSKHVYFITRMVACGILAVGCVGGGHGEETHMSKGYV